MKEIACPMCGKPNPPHLDTCQFCDARLRPLTDELSRSQPPIRPGEQPTPKSTAELEPILPHWLRQVRQQAKEAAEEETEQAAAQEEAAEQPEAVDLLAGLRSQPEDEEEIPDWLVNLRGQKRPQAEEKPPDESKTPAADESHAEALPGWIADLGSAASAPAQGAQDELAEWLANQEKGEEAAPVESNSASLPDLGWRAGLEAGFEPEAESPDAADLDVDLPDWLKSTGPDDTSQPTSTPAFTEQPPPPSADLPDWLASLEQETQAAPQTPALTEEPAQPAADMPDWLAALGQEPEAASQPASQPAFTEQPPPPSADMPDWLAALGQEPEDVSQPASTPAFTEQPSQPAADMPDWLAALGQEPEAASQPASQPVSQPASKPAFTEQPPQPSEDMPDWLAALGQEPEAASQPASQPAFTEQPPPPSADMPDWLAASTPESEPRSESPVSAFTEAPLPPSAEAVPDWLTSMEQTVSARDEERGPEAGHTTDWMAILGQKEQPSPGQEAASIPAFVDDEGTPLSSGDVDAIFSMEMPDWLSDIGSGEQSKTPSEESGESALSPAELPSWVRAMRPVEAVLSEGETAVSEQPLEEKGPLAGLRGVLPLPAQVIPSSKPKPYSLKLRASEEQQNSASLLEQLLVGESYPQPMKTTAVALSQRLLRQFLALLLLLAVGIPIFLNTNIAAVPFSVPNETNAAKQFVESNLPPDAAVLVVFDYEAALAGELEASAAPLIDYMVLLKHPRLCLLSTTPIGAGLSERFMKLGNTQVSTYYQAGQSYVNLGFLPGGAAGALAFAENPAETKPLDLNGRPAWETPVLQNVRQLSQFAAVILLTDDADSARLWIEQTQGKMGQAALLVVSSAQAGPMLQPYVQSQQIEGLVVGLGSSAPIEQINGGRPGLARRYWDAYGMGLMTAILLISVGGMWNLAGYWRSRQRERGK